MSETIKNLQDKRSSLARLDTLENNTQEIADKLNGVIGELNKTQELCRSIITGTDNALQVLGRQISDQNILGRAMIKFVDGKTETRFEGEGIQLMVEEVKREDNQSEVDGRFAQMQKMISEAKVVPTDKIDVGTFVGGLERDAEGKQLWGTLVYEGIAGVEQTLREQLMGKEKGFVVTTKQGSTFEVMEIYKPAPPMPTEAVTDTFTTASQTA